MMKFKGVLKKEIFSGDNGYLIASVEDIDTNEEIIIVGYVNLFKNQIYSFEGDVVEHDKYGEQILVSKYTLEVPKDGEEIINFLSSKSFENIGKRTAKKIVDIYGEESIDILKNRPEDVLENTNIKEHLIEELHNKLNALDGMEILYKLLNPLGFSEFYINEIYQFIQTNNILSVENLIKHNTFRLIDIESINFEKADKIFLYYNDEEKDDYRVLNAILDEIDQMCFKSGDTYVLYEDLSLSLKKKLKFEVVNLKEILSELQKENKVHIDGENISLETYYIAEKSIANNVFNRLEYLSLGLSKSLINTKISSIEKEIKHINYSDLQKEAIINSLSNNISIITGGPGTGKTTIIDAVVKIFENVKYGNEVIKDISSKIMLCAPTGRAAQRMKEATSMEAKTIHSLLEWDPYKNKFNRDANEPLIQDLIIIDEFSMVDIFLASSIFKAIKPNAIVILVGDSAQLESVNPGNVLHDLIKSNKIPTIHLDKIFRQGDGSTIAKFAKSIDKGIDIDFVNTNDMSLINRNNDLGNIIHQIVNKSYESGYDEMDVQVLYPKYSGRNGIDNINKLLLPNKSKKSIEAYGVDFYLGDKVMQLKNNYDKNIYNGDIGKIIHIYDAKKPNDLALEVKFKEKKVNLTKKDLLEIKHAYAISIHKSQGSEFKVIILPISKESKNMLNKKLIYTAITRAKDKLVIIGDMDCFKESILIEQKSRKTYLNKIIKSIFNQ